MSSGLANTKLFTPLQIGKYTLKHRGRIRLLSILFGCVR
jgi:hypothetical protein